MGNRLLLKQVTMIFATGWFTGRLGAETRKRDMPEKNTPTIGRFPGCAGGQIT